MDLHTEATCPYGYGNHKAKVCAKQLLDGLEDYIRTIGDITADEIVLEFIRLANDG